MGICLDQGKDKREGLKLGEVDSGKMKSQNLLPLLKLSQILMLGRRYRTESRLRLLLGTVPSTKAVYFSVFLFQMCKDQELHRKALVSLGDK